MKYKDTMESPWGVLKLTVLKSGPKLIGDFSFPATCWGPHPQRLGHGRASLRKHRHRCSWHRKFHSLTSMFFLMNHDPYHPWSGIFTYINYTWMDMDGMGDEHLKLQHPTSHLPSNRLKFCNLKIARSHSDRMGPWTSSTNTPFLTRSVWCFCFCLKTSPSCEVNVLQWYPLIGSIFHSLQKGNVATFISHRLKILDSVGQTSVRALAHRALSLMQNFWKFLSALRIDRMTLTDQDEPIEVLAAPVCRCGDQWEHQCINYGMSEPVQVLQWHSLNLLWKDGNVKSFACLLHGIIASSILSTFDLKQKHTNNSTIRTHFRYETSP